MTNETPTLKECAFCDYTGKLSREHIAAKWLRDLFPGPIKAWYGERNRLKGFTTDKVDFKATIVCQKCNETWMAAIEDKCAKPVLTPLVTGRMHIPIGDNDGRSIALFAFKMAVVIDHANRDRSPFFSRRLREAFRRTSTIPPFVQMWMCGYAGNRAGVHFKSIYHEGESELGSRFSMYSCTVALGNFAFQTLAVKQLGNASFRSLAPFPSDLAIPFWPVIHKGFVWPHRLALMSKQHFDAFANRWQNVEIIGDV